MPPPLISEIEKTNKKTKRKEKNHPILISPPKSRGGGEATSSIHFTLKGHILDPTRAILLRFPKLSPSLKRGGAIEEYLPIQNDNQGIDRGVWKRVANEGIHTSQ
jgi:hypothetical protein